MGAIDESHIPVIAPEEYPLNYYNQNGWHLIVPQAVVYGKCLFWDVSVGYLGSVQEYARVLLQSHLWEILSDRELLSENKVTISGCDVGRYLIGELAYLLENMLIFGHWQTDP